MTTRRRTTEVEDGDHREVVDEEHVQSTEVADSAEVVESHADPVDVGRGVIRTVGALAAVVLVTLETLLAFRFAFLLAGANENNGFVDFIYDATGWMVDPFEGIASTSEVDGGVFDPATLIAMAVVAAVGFIILMALWALTTVPSGGHRYSSTRTSHRTH